MDWMPISDYRKIMEVRADEPVMDNLRLEPHSERTTTQTQTNERAL